MKKVLIVMLVCIMSGCTEAPSVELDVSAFYPDAEVFSYPDVSYGDSIEETEEKLGYQLAGHSYTELMRQQLDKYGESTEAEQVSYIGTVDGKSVLVEYG